MKYLKYHTKYVLHILAVNTVLVILFSLFVRLVSPPNLALHPEEKWQFLIVAIVLFIFYSLILALAYPLGIFLLSKMKPKTFAFAYLFSVLLISLVFYCGNVLLNQNANPDVPTAIVNFFLSFGTLISAYLGMRWLQYLATPRTGRKKVKHADLLRPLK